MTTSPRMPRELVGHGIGVWNTAGRGCEKGTGYGHGDGVWHVRRVWSVSTHILVVGPHRWAVPHWALGTAAGVCIQASFRLLDTLQDEGFIRA